MGCGLAKNLRFGVRNVVGKPKVVPYVGFLGKIHLANLLFLNRPNRMPSCSKRERGKRERFVHGANRLKRMRGPCRGGG